MSAAPLFKILSAARYAERKETVPTAPIDDTDGFMHLSTHAQVRETARLHFANATHLVLLRLDPAVLKDLRWESSRGGALFPHVYEPVPLSAVLAVSQLVGEVAGSFEWPDDVL